MAKLNEGDVMEGIFAICLAELFANNDINKTNVNRWRRKVDPTIFRDGRAKITVREFKDGRPQDNIKVTLILRLKYESTNMAFGDNYAPLYANSKDIGNIDRKIDNLITFTKTNYRTLIKQTKDSYLKNNKSDNVEVIINADGIAGESSGGTIKGDLEVDVKMNGSIVMDKRLSFSLKSGSKTLANLSPFNGMMDILARFGVSLEKEVEYRTVLGEQLATAKTPAEKRLKVNTINNLYEDTLSGLSDKSSSVSFKSAAFKLFRDVTFGSDLANVVDIDKTKIKEITVEHINELEQNTNSIRVVESGKGSTKTLKFILQPLNEELFQLRFKKRTAGSGEDFQIKELKFYVEAGKGAYAPKL
tara:strand:+ start:125 stop:1204 length:1080 start_codon:yes stop_codon:yes gene_type:complete